MKSNDFKWSYLEQGNKTAKVIKSELITNYIMLATLQIKNN
ncbi:hypothetical protein ACV566_00695 [Staphylococcus aureus]